MKAKILLYDIETAPNLSWTWGKYEQNVIEFDKEWHILSFAYKWLGERNTHVVALPDFPTLYKENPENDLLVVGELHKLFDEADIVIAHNGDSFDQKKVHARFIYHDMTPPSPYAQIDTKKVARKYFAFNSNKLGDLGQHLGLGEKVDTGGFELWKGCMNGDTSSWNKMKKYNKQDVRLLEQIYLKMRPWISTHPPINTIEQSPDACPKCGSTELMKQGTRKTTSFSVYQRYTCKRCGGWARSRTAIPTQNIINFTQG